MMRVWGLSKHLLVELCKCSLLPAPAPLPSSSLLPPPNSFRPSWDCRRLLIRRIRARVRECFRSAKCVGDVVTIPIATTKTEAAHFLEISFTSGDIWRFDTGVCVSGFCPLFFSSFFVHPFAPLFSSLSPHLTSDEWQERARVQLIMLINCRLNPCCVFALLTDRPPSLPLPIIVVVARRRSTPH